MNTRPISKDEQIAQLRCQLKTAEDRLERAQSFLLDLRCCAARKEGRGLWSRDKDRSGMRAAVWDDTDALGPWFRIKAADVPEPNPLFSSSYVRELYFELGVATSSPPSSRPLTSSRFPPELFYHLTDHASKSTLLALCLVSSSVRVIVSPRLYQTMVVTSASQLVPFHPDPLAPSVPINLSPTLDQIVSLDIIVGHGMNIREVIGAEIYRPVLLPRLRHLFIRLKRQLFKGQGLGPHRDVTPLSLTSKFLSHLNPHSLAISMGSIPPNERGYDWGGSLGLEKSVWLEAVTPWKALSGISFVDVRFVDVRWLSTKNSGPLEQSPWMPLSPSDLPNCGPFVSLSWKVTDYIGGYAKVSTAFKRLGQRSPLQRIFSENINILSWPSVREHGIRLDIGDGQENRDALKGDLEKLRNEWKGLVHY